MAPKKLKRAQNTYQIVQTLLTYNNMQLVFSLSQDLQDIDFQTKTKESQSHGNKCAVDISHPRELRFLHCSVQGFLYNLINVLGPILVILQP